MIKFILAFSLLVICSLSGIKLSSKYKIRREFFSSLVNFNRDFYSAVNFRRDDMNDILSKSYESEIFNKLTSDKKSGLKNHSAINFPDFLSENEKVQLKSYFSKLGVSDAADQLKMSDDYQKIFEEMLKKSEDDDKKQGLLYKKMGVIVGLIAFIIAI